MRRALALGDLDHDGILDAAVPDEDRSLTVMHGAGDGTFRAVLNIPLQSPKPTSIVLGDFNSDGFSDAAVTGGGKSGTVAVLLGTRSGAFQPPVLIPVGKDPSSAAVGDVNGESRPDPVVVNNQSASVSVLLGNGNRHRGQAGKRQCRYIPGAASIWNRTFR